MTLLLLRVLKWALGKSLVILITGALIVGGYAIWQYASSSLGDEAVRKEALQQLELQAEGIYSQLGEAHERLSELGLEIQKKKAELESVGRTIAFLDGILERIERLVTMSRSERLARERELEEAEKKQADLKAALENSVLEQSKLRLDRLVLAEQAQDLEAKRSQLEASASAFAQILRDSWLKMRPYLIAAILGAVCLPILYRAFAYYVWAKLFSFAGAIRLEKEQLPRTSLVGSGVSLRVGLHPGDRIWLKEAFLQASDESMYRKTRFLLNWAIPGTCLAAGLTELIEMQARDKPASVTVSPQRRPELEVAMIEIPESGKMIMRPSNLVGLVSRTGDSVSIERRWRLFHPQAWLTFQFRYFVFKGPCALLVAGVRGVRFETLDAESSDGRRGNQVATIGFTPDLSYGVTRAETFWSYFRGFNPLFDDVFRGQGAFVCHEISEKDQPEGVRFWAAVWNGILKVIGI